MYTKANHGLSTLFQPGRVAQSVSRSTGDQEDRVRKNFLLSLIQIVQLSVLAERMELITG